jgi:hypothetical protein
LPHERRDNATVHVSTVGVAANQARTSSEKSTAGDRPKDDRVLSFAWKMAKVLQQVMPEAASG